MTRKYEIYLRREWNDIGISITDINTHELVYKNGFKSNTDYKNDPRFIELQNVFIKYLKEENVDITFMNNDRTFKLLANLIGENNVLDYEDIDLYDPIYLNCNNASDIFNKETNTYSRITIHGGKIYGMGDIC